MRLDLPGKVDLKGFRTFILRGNVVDLAVAVVIGAAFGAIVTALVADFVTPLIGAVFGGRGAFGDLAFTVHHSRFRYGDLINKVVSFVVVAAVVYFLVVLPVNALMARFKPTAAQPAPTTTCPECLSSIPLAARRCAFCTAQLG